MSYVVNVEVFLRRNNRWLLIERGAGESNAPGMLAGVGGQVDVTEPTADVLEETGRREVAEEIGVDLTGVPMRYVHSTFFVADDGLHVINVVFAAALPVDAHPVITDPAEVADILFLPAADLAGDPRCPQWLHDSIARAAAAL
jgi:8-oxo-dGTP pyrophosphatase MutT (NUDIX family)